MTNWASWKQKYKKELWHIAGFEEIFVDKVLSQIPQITPSDVTPQYRFVDSTGKSRYIDFIIINKAKGYLLPIELDGFSKDKRHVEWIDFLKRQNDLITQFGIVLRFSNKQMFDDPIDIVRKIQQTLKLQSEKIATFPVPTTNPKLKPQAETTLPVEIIGAHKANSNRLLMVMFTVVVVSIIYAVSINQKPTISKKLSTERLVVEDIEPISRVERVRTPKQHIAAHNAVEHIGTSQLVCGPLAEVYEFRNGVYLNFVKTFPDTPFTAVVWDSLHKKILLQGIRLEHSLHNEICVEGEISSYNGQTQVIVHSLANLTLRKE
ncbi:hypothetical protein [Vibrio atypicus]|uniref:hypothetical protein n=1 Tax=Vibrio atypicus TaxID=558271 RepID=UPI0037367ED1